MLNSTFQPAFKGGDMCRVSRSASAIQSALVMVETAVHSALQAIYRGGIDKKSHNSSSQFQPLRERFMKQKANKHNTKQRPRSMSEVKLKAKGIFFDLDGTIVD
jgi:hypothetical protein